MKYHGLNDFIDNLLAHGELQVIDEYVNPSLEITEVAHRVMANGGKALLFTNNGTNFPVLINAFGSDNRLNYAFGESVGNIPKSIDTLFNTLSSGSKGLSNLPHLLSCLPKKKLGKGKCQQVILRSPDLSILPVLKCWPHDGGKFITLPIVHTIHPVTGKKNIGMYRMQIIDNQITAMHWQRHKTGANHYEAWKEVGKVMPVSVILGGDPVYTYSATAPLPEGIDEYMLAGFIRKRRVKMVKCITNELWVPEDADIVIEGYVDTSEGLFLEGPFGDHTGFYSLADMYPKFHVTCITHRKNAVYPATIVGVPPMEDAYFAKATETVFLAPIKMVVQPEIVDIHMPEVGVAHNLAIVKINKTYPGQGKKVISSMFGAGQMMFTKVMVVVDCDVDIRNYGTLISHVLRHVSLKSDLVFTQGPIDILDHSSNIAGFGGKVGIDATVKVEGESVIGSEAGGNNLHSDYSVAFRGEAFQKATITSLPNLPIVVMQLPVLSDDDLTCLKNSIKNSQVPVDLRLLLIVDNTLNPNDIYLLSWFVLANIDPVRDCFINDELLVVDGTIKAYRNGFSRKWPNVVMSSEETIKTVDAKWGKLGLGSLIISPSIKLRVLLQNGKDYIINNNRS